MVKKTELSTTPGMQVNFMRYRSLEGARQLVEGVRMETHALSAEMITITVAEHGFAVAMTELLLNASFDDVMSSAARLLGRNMALYLDGQCRDVLMSAPSVLYGYDRMASWASSQPRTPLSPYDNGMHADSVATMSTNGGFYFTSALVKDAVETLATKNVPRLGETYVAFVHPHQSRRLRDDPSYIEVTKYAAPGNFMLGEVGRIADCVFIESTQVFQGAAGTTQQSSTIPTGVDQTWDGQPARSASGSIPAIGAVTASPVVPANPGPYQTYNGLVIGDNAAGHAISLPVELRDGGVQDYGREHSLCWYSVYGLGLITDYAVVQCITN